MGAQEPLAEMADEAHAALDQASTMKRPRPLTIVIKLGTSSIADEQTHEPLLPVLTLIVDTAVKLRKNGHRVVIVSLGAIGQCRLISLWDSLFGHLSQPVAQILLTRNDIADRTRYINAQNTFNQLMETGVIPIVNENDTLAVSEIKFGDNDTLSAITAAMIHADMLFLMTDVDCLYDKNPRVHTDARPIEIVGDISELEADVSNAGSALGTGGMSTKIVAAKLGTLAGVTTIVTRSSNPGNILAIVRYLASDDGPAEPVAEKTQSLNLGAVGERGRCAGSPAAHSLSPVQRPDSRPLRLAPPHAQPPRNDIHRLRLPPGAPRQGWGAARGVRRRRGPVCAARGGAPGGCRETHRPGARREALGRRRPRGRAGARQLRGARDQEDHGPPERRD